MAGHRTEKVIRFHRGFVRTKLVVTDIRPLSTSLLLCVGAGADGGAHPQGRTPRRAPRRPTPRQHHARPCHEPLCPHRLWPCRRERGTPFQLLDDVWRCGRLPHQERRGLVVSVEKVSASYYYYDERGRWVNEQGLGSCASIRDLLEARSLLGQAMATRYTTPQRCMTNTNCISVL